MPLLRLCPSESLFASRSSFSYNNYLSLPISVVCRVDRSFNVNGNLRDFFASHENRTREVNSFTDAVSNHKSSP